jgi:hypothetical protein
MQYNLRTKTHWKRIMAKRIYRVVSVCGALGYGYPKESLETALEKGVDERDVFGAQRQAPIESLGIPMYVEVLDRPAVA